MKVSLSILNVDYSNPMQELAPICESVEYIHMDVMDGNFVPNISFGPSFIKSLRKKISVPFDTHLMIDNPIDYIEEFALAGSDLITFHVEAKSDVMETIDKIKSCGKKAGISIKPKTGIQEILKYLPYVDLVLVMSVEPGFGGQHFMNSAVQKIEELAEYRAKNSLNYLISVDGGINDITANLVKEVNADFVVVGSYILDKVDPKKKLEIISNI